MKGGKIIIFLGLLFIVAAGCAATSEWPQFSGFLGNYKGMYRSSDVEGLFVIKHNEKNVDDYSIFLVDPVKIEFIPDAKAYNMDKKTVEMIAKAFRNNIITALQSNYKVVDSPGKGVLRLRVAITDILKSKGASSEGIIEAEFVDTQTRQRIGAVLTSKKGMNFKEWSRLLRDHLDYLDSDKKVFQTKR